MGKRALVFLTIMGVALGPATAWAGSPRKLVEKGNVAFAAGNYDQALEAYDQAAVEMPESAPIYFDKGAAFYRKGDFDKAARAFEQAALKSKTTALEAKSRFNLGLCSFRQAQRQKDSDPGKALEACETSVRHFQDALKLKPDFREAAENIEVVRLTMKSMLDAIEKQKEQARKADQARRNSADQIRQLIEKQQALLNRSTQLQTEAAQKGERPDLKSKISDLAEEQAGLARQTAEAAQTWPAPGSASKQPNSAAPDPSKTHLERAASEQEAASKNLKNSRTASARDNQQKALDELKDALGALESKKGAPQTGAEHQGGERKPSAAGNAQNQNRQQKDLQEAARTADKTGRLQEQQPNETKEPAILGRLPDNPQQILDEERENRSVRRLGQAGGYNPVDKDW